MATRWPKTHEPATLELWTNGSRRSSLQSHGLQLHRVAADVAFDGRVVVCAVDGSTSDGNAAEVATQLAVLAGARVALVAVAPVPVASARAWGLPTWTMDEARAALELTADLIAHRVDVVVYLDSGNPVRRLVELAERKRALLLVVGTHGAPEGGPASIVASGLARNAPCPVVVVPEAARVPALDTALDAGLDTGRLDD